MVKLLGQYDTIVTAWCEPASGPGWSNTPLWYLVRDGDGKLRIECLQPNERSEEIAVLYNVCAAAQSSLVGYVRKHVLECGR